MFTKEEYISQVEAQLPKFDSDINVLRARLRSVHRVDMLDCCKKVDELCTKYTILRLRLQALRETEDENWDLRRRRIERAIRELRQSIENVGTWVWVRTAE